MGDLRVYETTSRQPEVEEPQVEEIQEPDVDDSETAGPLYPIQMKSVDRVSKLPVVEETLNIAVNICGRVRVRSFP